MSFDSLILNCYCLSVNVAGGGWLCAVVVRGMSVVCPGRWLVVCGGGGVCCPSMSPCVKSGHSNIGGGCGIFRGSAIFVYVKSLHLPHTIPESTSTASAASSLPALLNSPYWFLDNDRRSFSKVKYMHKHAMPQNTITTVLDTVFLYIVYLHIKSLTFMPLALILYSS